MWHSFRNILQDTNSFNEGSKVLIFTLLKLSINLLMIYTYKANVGKGIIVICNLRTNANLLLGAVNPVLKEEDEYFTAWQWEAIAEC